MPAPRPLIDAAVLVPVYRDAAGELRVVLVRRSEGGPHGGQIAFPGGKLDPDDGSLRDAALREAREEIGLPSDAAHVLAELDPFETRVTGFLIHPFLARIIPPPRWLPAEREVVEVLEPSVAELLDPAHRGSSMEVFDEWPDPVRIEFIDVAGHRLWGATYRILAPLLPRLAAGEWEI
jgi:8-oxo-dGTP pyrophosphatase MutT (NUDIX family)